MRRPCVQSRAPAFERCGGGCEGPIARCVARCERGVSGTLAPSRYTCYVRRRLQVGGGEWWRDGWCGVADSALSPLCTHLLRSRSPRTHESEPSPSPSPRGTSADEASSRGRVPRGQPATERVHRCAVPPRLRGVVVGVVKIACRDGCGRGMLKF